MVQFQNQRISLLTLQCQNIKLAAHQKIIQNKSNRANLHLKIAWLEGKISAQAARQILIKMVLPISLQTELITIWTKKRFQKRQRIVQMWMETAQTNQEPTILLQNIRGREMGTMVILGKYAPIVTCLELNKILKMWFYIFTI